MNYQDYIKTELLVLAPVLYIVGLGLKKSPLRDKLIPIALGAVGICLSAIWVFSTTETQTIPQVAAAIFTSVTQGILTAGASVYANQIYAQSKKEN